MKAEPSRFSLRWLTISIIAGITPLLIAQGYETNLIAPAPPNSEEEAQNVWGVTLGRTLDLRRGGAHLRRGDETKEGKWALEGLSEVHLWNIPGYPSQWRWNFKGNWQIERLLSPKWGALVTGEVEKFQYRQRAPYQNLLVDPVPLPQNTQYVIGDPFYPLNSPLSEDDQASVIVGGIFIPNPTLKLKLGSGLKGWQKGNRKHYGDHWVGELMWKEKSTELDFFYARSSTTPFGETTWKADGEGTWQYSPYAEERFVIHHHYLYQPIVLSSYEPIGQRRDHWLSLDNRLVYHLSSYQTITWLTLLDRRESQLTRYLDSEIKSRNWELNWRNRLNLDWVDKVWRWGASGELNLNDQEYGGLLTQTRTARLGGKCSISSGTGRTLEGELLVRRYWLDTPSLQDLNDRDELGFKGKVEGTLPITSYIVMKLSGGVDRNHLVYLFRPRSSENRRESFYLLEWQGLWKGLGAENRLNSQLTSQITAYDFQPWRLNSSRIFRTFTISDTLILRPRAGWESWWGGSVTWSELGQLDPDLWVRSVVERGKAIGNGVMVSRRNPWGYWGVGGEVYSRTTRPPDSERQGGVSQKVLSYGPRGEILIQGRNTTLKGEGVWRWTKEKEGKLWEMPDFTIQYTYNW